MEMPADVERFIERAFHAADRDEARSLLASATIHDGSPAGDRLVRCAALAGRGSLERLRYYVDLLKIDYRDVIVAGEYTPSIEPVRLRDLNQPIDEREADPPA